MKKNMSKEDWDRQYAAGKWRFLRKAEEQERLVQIANMIGEVAAVWGKAVVVDLGSGEGQLYRWLSPEHVKTYVGMDISQVALMAIQEDQVPVVRVCSSLEEFSYMPDWSPVIYVASEVLTYNQNSVQQLNRIVEETPQVGAVIVSVVGPHPDKPNWTIASEEFWKKMGALSWPVPEKIQVQDEDSGIVWDIANYQFKQP